MYDFITLIDFANDKFGSKNECCINIRVGKGFYLATFENIETEEISFRSFKSEELRDYAF